MQAHFLGAEAWDRIAPTWRAWHAADSSAALYESPEYARYKMSELPQNFVGGILELAEGDASVAYVPFRMQRSLAGIPTRDIQTLGLGAHAPNHSAPSSAVVAEALRALRPYRCRVETLEPEHSPVGRLRGYEALSGKDGVIPLASTWESFVETQSSRMRKHLRHALRVMEKKEWRIEDLSHQAEPAIEQANVLHDAYLNHKFPVYRGQYRAAQRDASFASCLGKRLGPMP